MKINFDIEDYKVTYGEIFKYFDERRDRELRGNLNGEIADAVGKLIEDLNRETDGIPTPDDYPPAEEGEAHRLSVYMTACVAVGNDYKYPETEEEEDVQDLLSFVLSGSFYLILETLERYMKRELNKTERVFFAASLNDLTYSIYFQKHPEKLAEVGEEEEEEGGDGE